MTVDLMDLLRGDSEEPPRAVESECVHERLPGDPCPSPDGAWPFCEPCGCWQGL